MSLKAWIASICLVIEAAILAAVVYATSSHALRNDADLLAESYGLATRLLGEFGQNLSHGDLRQLQALIDRIAVNPSIEAIRVAGPTGWVEASTDPREIGLKVAAL